MELWVLDRIEDNRVVLVREDGMERVLDRSEIPRGAREGDALRAAGPEGGETPYVLDVEATDRLREEAGRLRDSMRRGPSGPLSL